MNKKSGEIVIGLLVGLAVGAAILIIDAGNEAQEVANRTGVGTSAMDVIADQPGQSTFTLLGPAAAGAGIGWAIDELSGKNEEKTEDSSIQVDGNGNVIVIGGDGGGDGQGGIDNSEDNSGGF